MSDGPTKARVDGRQSPIWIAGKVALVLFGPGLVLVGFCMALLGTMVLFFAERREPGPVPWKFIAEFPLTGLLALSLGAWLIRRLGR